MLTVEYMPMQYYDAIIISFTAEDGTMHHIFVDGGDINSPKYCYTDRLKKNLETLFNNGETIDLWIVTHIDNDHIGGIYNFINDTDFFNAHQGQLKEVWMNYGGKGDYTVQREGNIGYESGKMLRDALKEKQICVKEGLMAGHTVSIADVTITVVAPDKVAWKRYVAWWNNKEFKDMVETADGQIKGGDWDYEKKFKEFDLTHYDEDKEVKNNSSIAFVLSYHGHQLLFAADSCTSILESGLKKANIMVDGKLKLGLMHIPHHGSSRNTSTPFLQRIDCLQYVITGNCENRYKLPDKETVARLINANPAGCELHFTQINSKLKEIFSDDDCGNLKVEWDAHFKFE